MPTTALVLSAGGMFGAYQAGAWDAIQSLGITPDLVVGASIGSLNAWAIAGHCPPEELLRRWSDLESAAQLDWRLPWPPHRGLLDPARLESRIRDIHSSYTPRIPYGVVLTRLRGLRPELFTSGITWQHLAASCAVPVIFPTYTIQGRAYTDGGFLNALPLWAAERMGATRIIAVDAWTPSPWLRLFLRPLRLRRRAIPPRRPHSSLGAHPPRRPTRNHARCASLEQGERRPLDRPGP